MFYYFKEKYYKKSNDETLKLGYIQTRYDEELAIELP